MAKTPGIDFHEGKWRARWTDHSGRRPSAHFELKRDAVRHHKIQVAETERIRAGLELAPPVDRTFSDLSDWWLEHRVPQMGAASTQRSMIRKHLRPFFGGALLRNITAADADRFVATRRKLKPKTINNLLTCLISMLNHAVAMDWLLRAPKIRKLRAPEADFQHLNSMDEVWALVAAAEPPDEEDGLAELFATACLTGMRAGELAGLRWSRVSFDRRLITVAASYDKATKSRRIRHVPIVDALLPRLRAWRLRNGNALVFPNQAGHMHQPCARVFQESYHRCLSRADLPRMTFHSLRHTFAALFVTSGGNLFSLQKILGHSTPQMTMRYAHLQPEAFADDWARFGETRGMDDGPVSLVREAVR